MESQTQEQSGLKEEADVQKSCFTTEQLQQKYKVAIETVLKQEGRKFNDVFDPSASLAYIIVYFGIGDDKNHQELSDLLKEFAPFDLRLYPQCSYGYLRLQDEQTSEKLRNQFRSVPGIDFSQYLLRPILQQSGKNVCMPCFFFNTKLSPEGVQSAKKLDIPDAKIVTDIDGMLLNLNYLDKESESALANAINQRTWTNIGKKKLQVYGCGYDFEKHAILAEADSGVQPVPAQLAAAISKIRQQFSIGAELNQVTVQESFPGSKLPSVSQCFAGFR